MNLGEVIVYSRSFMNVMEYKSTYNEPSGSRQKAGRRKNGFINATLTVA